MQNWLEMAFSTEANNTSKSTTYHICLWLPVFLYSWNLTCSKLYMDQVLFTVLNQELSINKYLVFWGDTQLASDFMNPVKQYAVIPRKDGNIQINMIGFDGLCLHGISHSLEWQCLGAESS